MKRRVLLAFMIYVVLIAFHGEDNLAGDGCNEYGYPVLFYSVCHNDFGDNVSEWHPGGIAINLLFFIFMVFFVFVFEMLIKKLIFLRK